ncbi:hypothetical protein ABB37_05764 [Leptomonas pyrrhocoris]|uniref:Uncharacterized protein n=1 Tax=Leptomonas pyrrhocoris TaxID=157538 RepID=A0A0N0VEZ6_LEPPY|nr:hypothetical protein ABB37_05764 [Leptomonas pyrrhocoris]KPA79301.1 hypothetical protein ABB37_05764 [Leptomonas pyrrhocoris]|eukprot:XP_015657740.1 hypothetical protein ABB37_05764 [Leptomonas pyrrhocoris]
MSSGSSSNVSEVESTHTPARPAHNDQPQTPSRTTSSPSRTPPENAGESRTLRHVESTAQQPQRQRIATAPLTVNTSRAPHPPPSPIVEDASTGSPRSAPRASTAVQDGASLSVSLSAAPPPSELQVVADLRSELFHISRQLAQVRQQARAVEEARSDLRQKCQGLEAEKQALALDLQGAQDRLRVCQTRLDEHRREAADEKLRVLSLTAERDELDAKVQEAWHRVVELGAALQGQQGEVKRLQEAAAEARHEKEFIAQQQTALQSQLHLLQEQLSAEGVDVRAHAAARERLTTALHEAVQRLAGVLSDVAYDYQRSVAHNDEPFHGSRQSAKELFRITGAAEDAGDALAGAGGVNPPHVVLFSASRSPPTPTPTDTAAAPSSSSETARLHAERLLHNAEAVVWGDASDGPAEATPTSVRPSASVQQHDVQQQQPGEDAASATPPEFKSPSWTRQFMIERRRATSPSTTPSSAALSEQVFLRTALSPILLAMKHVAAMLGTVRHEHRRTVAAAEHFQTRYEETQKELEAAQRALREQETQSGASRGLVLQLQQKAQQADDALQRHTSEEAQRRAALASVLRCREDWALIQHSVERLLGQHAELQKDLDQLEAARSMKQEGVQRSGADTEVFRGVRLGPQEDEEQQRRQTPRGRDDSREGASDGRHSQHRQQQADMKDDTPPSLPDPPLSQQLDRGGAAAADGDTDTGQTLEPAEVPSETFAEARHYKASQAPPLPLPPSAASLVDTPTPIVRHSIYAATPENGAINASLESQPVMPSRRPVSRTYPASLPEAPSASFSSSPAARPPLPTAATTTERMLLYSLYGDVRKQPQPQPPSQPHGPPSPPPLPVSPSAVPSRQRSHTYGHAYDGGSKGDSDNNHSGSGGINQSSVFAAEVLQVIEALDRRVSGALRRAPHS